MASVKFKRSPVPDYPEMAPDGGDAETACALICSAYLSRAKASGLPHLVRSRSTTFRHK